MKYCLEKEDKIRNFNSKQAAKRALDKHGDSGVEESLAEEDFENIPEFEQSFQTMRADDEALDSYGDEQAFLFAQEPDSPAVQSTDLQYQSERIDEAPKSNQQVSRESAIS